MTARQPTRAEIVNAILAYLRHDDSDEWSGIHLLMGVLEQTAKSSDFQAMIAVLEHRRRIKPNADA